MLATLHITSTSSTPTEAVGPMFVSNIPTGLNCIIQSLEAFVGL